MTAPEAATGERSSVRRTFRKLDRVRRKSDFERGYRDGFRVSTRLLLWVVRPNGLARARLGISAGRRIGSAPCRNRVKRRLRELFRKDPELRCRPVDVILNVRAAGTDGFVEMDREYRRGSALVRRRLGVGPPA